MIEDRASQAPGEAGLHGGGHAPYVPTSNLHGQIRQVLGADIEDVAIVCRRAMGEAERSLADLILEGAGHERLREVEDRLEVLARLVELIDSQIRAVHAERIALPVREQDGLLALARVDDLDLARAPVVRGQIIDGQSHVRLRHAGGQTSVSGAGVAPRRRDQCEAGKQSYAVHGALSGTRKCGLLNGCRDPKVR